MSGNSGRAGESWWGDILAAGEILACPLWLGNFLSTTQEKFLRFSLSETFISPPAGTVLVILFISSHSLQLSTTNSHQNLMNHSNEFWLFGYG